MERHFQASAATISDSPSAMITNSPCRSAICAALRSHVAPERPATAAARPMAMAEAFTTGKLGILDYYKLRNVQADTDMRKAIASVGSTSPVKT